MDVVEFQVEVRGKVIEIPEEYQQNLVEGSTVKVTLLKTPKRFSNTGMIAQLRKNPIKVQDFKPLSRDEIYDRP